MKNLIYSIVVAMVFIVSCTNNDYDGPSPTQRANDSIISLRKELTSAPHGWRMIYFPRTDSLLFTNLSTKLKYEDQYGNFGYGGYYYLVKFDAEGNMIIKDDETADASEQHGAYTVRQGSFTQLSFTTYTTLHKLIGSAFNGKADFLYGGHDVDGNLMLRTFNYLEPAKEYIVLQRIESKEAWQDNASKAYDNRIAFEKMENPQIRIHTGDKIHFLSDFKMKVDKKSIEEILTHRFYLFTWAKELAADPSAYPRTIVGLGSGYVGTEQGLTFRAGIRLSSKYIFYDFVRQGNRFVCELVQVYDPHTLKPRFIAKHLATKMSSKPTGYIAEIFDAK